MTYAKCQDCDKVLETHDEAVEHMSETMPDEPGGESHKIMQVTP